MQRFGTISCGMTLRMNSKVAAKEIERTKDADVEDLEPSVGLEDTTWEEKPTCEMKGVGPRTLLTTLLSFILSLIFFFGSS